MGFAGLPAPELAVSCDHCNAVCAPQGGGTSVELFEAHQCPQCGQWACVRCINEPCDPISEKVRRWRYFDAINDEQGKAEVAREYEEWAAMLGE